jgi:hypothetical protein
MGSSVKVSLPNAATPPASSDCDRGVAELAGDAGIRPGLYGFANVNNLKTFAGVLAVVQVGRLR